MPDILRQAATQWAPMGHKAASFMEVLNSFPGQRGNPAVKSGREGDGVSSVGVVIRNGDKGRTKGKFVYLENWFPAMSHPELCLCKFNFQRNTTGAYLSDWLLLSGCKWVNQ